MAGGGQQSGTWDFFVSYTRADQQWATWIAWVLEEHHYKVLVQAWDFVAGSNWVHGMQAGTRDAARTIAVLSGAYLDSQFGGAEWEAAWASDPGGADRKLLVIRVADCDRPGLLAGVVSVDVFGLDEPAARDRLLNTVTAAIAGRAKPATAPEYPGAGRAVAAEPYFPGGTPRIWGGKIPPRNPHFTGRDDELSTLAHRLATGSRVMVHSVHGMGGIGKTQMAAEYAYARDRGYDLVWWIAAEEPAAIPDQFTALAAGLGLDPAADPDALQAQVHGKLRTVPGWLLIFDNADAIADIQPWLPPGPMPPGVPGHVIVTTRRGGFAALGQVMDLDVIDLAGAVELLRSRVPHLGQNAAEQIAGELGRLPLALEQAAAYLDISGMPGREYLELLRTRAADLYRRGMVAARQDVTIATLWDLSLERISAQQLAAVQLLDVCAYLAPEPIPPDLFTTQHDRLPQPLSAAAADPLAFADTVAVLADYSLAKRTPAGLQVHRLVQATIRARHPRGGSGAPAADLTGQAAGSAPAPASDPLTETLAVLYADAPEKIASVPAAWPRWAVLLPHVLAATGHLGQAAGKPGPAGMEHAAWLLDWAGEYLRVRGRPADAKPLHERALALSEAVHGPDHPDVGPALTHLAQTLQDLGQPGAARPLQERALAIGEAAYGPDHPTVALRLNNLAQTLQDLGQPEAARPLQERALAIGEAMKSARPAQPGEQTGT
jgi:tetratricopeptide (TPR) repeat protein